MQDGRVIQFAANLGFLWSDRPLPDAIGAAAAAGFDAVECHMPYDHDPAAVRSALDEANLPMLGINTDHSGPEVGVGAIPGREDEARADVDRAIDYAVAIGCPAIHVMAGRTWRADGAEVTYRANLAYAAERAVEHGLTVYVEPISTNAFAGYHLHTVDQAVETIEAMRADGVPDVVRVILDLFHVVDMGNDVLDAVALLGGRLGHVQIASYPDRGEPDAGNLDCEALLPAIVNAGYEGYFAAEYRPRSDLEAGLAWLSSWLDRRAV